MAVRTLNLELPEETIRSIEQQVALGRYADAETMVQAALEKLQVEDESFDDWIRREVLPALDELEANPASGYTLEQMRAAIDEEEKSHFRKAG